MVAGLKRPLTAVVALAFLNGCAPTVAYQAHPDFHEKRDRIKTIGVLPPRAEVFRQETGGEIRKMDYWSIEAEKNLLAAVLEELKARPGLVAKMLPESSLPDEARSNLRETQALFRAVNEGVLERVYGENQKIEDFDYTLGKEVRELGFGDVDALLIVRAIENETAGPGPGDVAAGILGVTLLAGIIVPPLLPAAVAGAGGVTLVAAPVGAAILAGGTAAAATVWAAGNVSELRGAYVSIALVDARTGTVLWYNWGVGKNLANPYPSRIVKGLLSDPPVSR